MKYPYWEVKWSEPRIQMRHLPPSHRRIYEKVLGSKTLSRVFYEPKQARLFAMRQNNACETSSLEVMVVEKYGMHGRTIRDWRSPMVWKQWEKKSSAR